MAIKKKFYQSPVLLAYISCIIKYVNDCLLSHQAVNKRFIVCVVCVFCSTFNHGFGVAASKNFMSLVVVWGVRTVLAPIHHVVMSRESLRDIKLRHIHVPKGVKCLTVVTSLHTDPQNWGEQS